WEMLERSRGATFVDFATLATWRERDPAGLRVVDALRREQLDVKREIALDRFRGGTGWDERTWRPTLRSLRLRARLDRLETDYLARNRPGDVDLERVRALLGPGEALIGWLDLTVNAEPGYGSEDCRSQGWGYVLRPDRPL